VSWPGTIGVALLTGAVGALAAGYVASLAVGWYSISSFEGGSGYFVVAFALLGIVAGIVVGLVAGRAAGGGSLRALGTAQAVLLGMVAVVGGAARLLADVPPTVDGRELMLAVEVRWPASQRASPATLAGPASLRLGALGMARVERVSELGPLWVEDAHQVDGRWVTPGVVNVFTNRGRRMLAVQLGDSIVAGLLMPLGRPGRRDFAWSDWLPRPGGAAPPGGFAYRYRVRFVGDSARAEALGPFEVVTMPEYYREAGAWLTGYARFAVRHRGTPVVAESDGARHERFDEIVVLPGDRAALLAHAPSPERDAGSCFLIVDDGARPRVELVSRCYGVSEAVPLTNDSALWHAARKLEPVRGLVDRTTLARGGEYLLRDAVLDVSHLASRRLQEGHGEGAAGMAPLGVSPDGRSFVRFGFAQGDDNPPQLIVTDAVERRNYALPIDQSRMRYLRVEDLDPAWVQHHFAWERDAGGVDRLVVRKGFTPIPYRGQLTDTSSSIRWYRLAPAKAELCDTVIRFLVAEFHAERRPPGDDQYARPLSVDGQKLTVECRPDDHYVDVQTEYQAKDTRILESVARRFDAELATGKYDALFGR
jgi:hypothetical protein